MLAVIALAIGVAMLAESCSAKKNEKTRTEATQLAEAQTREEEAFQAAILPSRRGYLVIEPAEDNPLKLEAYVDELYRTNQGYLVEWPGRDFTRVFLIDETSKGANEQLLFARTAAAKARIIADSLSRGPNQARTRTALLQAAGQAPVILQFTQTSRDSRHSPFQAFVPVEFPISLEKP